MSCAQDLAGGPMEKSHCSRFQAAAKSRKSICCTWIFSMKRWNYIKMSEARQGTEGVRGAERRPNMQKNCEKPKEYTKVVH